MKRFLNHLKQVLDIIKTSPVLISDAYRFIASSARIIECAARIGRDKLVDQVAQLNKQLLSTLYELFIKTNHVPNIAIPYTLSALASILSTNMYLGEKSTQIIELGYLLTKLFDMDYIASLRRNEYSKFVSITTNLLFITAYLILLTGDVNKELIKTIINGLINGCKWLLFRGYSALPILLKTLIIATGSIRYMDSEEIEEIHRLVKELLGMFIDSWEKRECETILLSEELIMYLKSVSDKIKHDEVKEVMERIIPILKRNGYKKKVSRIEGFFKRKPGASILDIIG